jgi:hypothetical protein
MAASFLIRAGGLVTVSSDPGPSWESSTKPSVFDLSESERTFTLNASSSGDKLISGKTTKTTGKWHYGITVLALPGGQVGIGTVYSAMTFSSEYLGQYVSSVGYFSNGNVVHNATLVTTLPTFTAGDDIDVILDLDNDRVFFAKNGGYWNNNGTANPVDGTGAISLSGYDSSTNPSFIGGFANHSSSGPSVRLLRTSELQKATPSGVSVWTD